MALSKSPVCPVNFSSHRIVHAADYSAHRGGEWTLYILSLHCIRTMALVEWFPAEQRRNIEISGFSGNIFAGKTFGSFSGPTDCPLANKVTATDETARSPAVSFVEKSSSRCAYGAHRVVKLTVVEWKVERSIFLASFVTFRSLTGHNARLRELNFLRSRFFGRVCSLESLFLCARVQVSHRGLSRVSTKIFNLRKLDNYLLKLF